MVQRFSAQIYVPSAYRIPVNKNHTDIVKFGTTVDTTYIAVVSHIKECISKCGHGHCSVITIQRNAMRVHPLTVLIALGNVDTNPVYPTSGEAAPSPEYGVVERVPGPSSGADIECVSKY